MTSSNQKSEIRNPKSTLILGGGLAGIAAAVRLAQSGVPVTLIETRKRLGGRATSFVDPTTKEVLDNCQHVLLGCCTNLIDLYQRLGVADQIHWHTKLFFSSPSPRREAFLPPPPRGEAGRRALSTETRRHSSPPPNLPPKGEGEERPWIVDELEADDLPAPLHMTRALMAFKTLTLREKLAISRGMLAMMRLGHVGREKLHGITFAQWLQEHNQPPGAIEKFWSVIVISAINELPERMAAPYAIHVFQDAFLANERGYVMGLAAVPLVQLYDAAERVITSAGGTLMLGRSVERILFDGRRVTGVELDGGETLASDHVISALPFDRLAKICPDKMVQADPRLARLSEFEVSPIIGIHLWFECPGTSGGVMTLPHLVLMRSPIQWIFNKGLESRVSSPVPEFLAARGLALPRPETTSQHLHAVISAAHDLVDTPADEIIALAVREIRKALPLAANVRVVHARVVKEKRATFSALPGVESIRPTAAGSIPGVFLAGDWCRTGWPATMEGAARSGYLAAAALLNAIGDAHAEPALVPDLPMATLYRAISR